MQAARNPIGQASHRLEPLDVLRGMAALGILLINIRFMGGAMGDALPRGDADWLDGDWLVWGASAITLEGTMRGLFTMLFGASILLATRKPGSSDRALARAGGLLLLGAVNAVLLLWPGDVLFLYGLCVPALLLARGWGTRRLLGIAFGLLACSIAWQAQHTQRMRANLAVGLDAEIAADAGEKLAPDEWRKFAAREQALLEAGAVSAAAQADEAASRRGTYAQAARWSAKRWQDANLGPFLAGGAMESVAMMLLGMVLLRAWRAEPKRTSAPRLALLGYAIGLPAKCWVVAAAIQGASEAAWLSAFMEHAGRIGMALGHAGAIMGVIGLVSAANPLRRALACVGRLALSNYLLASLLAGLWFWGLGQWGRQDWAGLWAVAFAIWAVQICASLGWEARFGAGPAERLLRAIQILSVAPDPDRPREGARLMIEGWCVISKPASTLGDHALGSRQQGRADRRKAGFIGRVKRVQQMGINIKHGCERPIAIENRHYDLGEGAPIAGDMPRKGMHIGHNKRLLLRSHRAANPFAKGNAQATQAALVGAHDQLARIAGINEVESRPQKPLGEGGVQQAGRTRITRDHERLAGINSQDFFAQSAIAR